MRAEGAFWAGHPEVEKDGCAVDFTEHAISAEEAEEMLVPEGEEVDEEDDDAV